MQTNEIKITWKGWLSLFLFVFLFSGLIPALAEKFPQITWLKALDFSALIGKFGTDLVGSQNGAAGARRGFMEAFILAPTVMLALGLIEIFEHHGALNAAQKLFQPFFRLLLGIPGIAGLAFVASLNSSDVGSAMTRKLTEEGSLTEDERTIFVAYQYAGSATITNTIGAGSALLPITLLAPGVIIGIQIIAKIIGANLVRFILKFQSKKETQKKEGEE